jgi:hypothetical protein
MFEKTRWGQKRHALDTPFPDEWRQLLRERVVHWNHLDVIAGIPYITLQSLIENLDDDAPGRAAAAYAICDLDDRRLVVTVYGAEQQRYQLELGR